MADKKDWVQDVKPHGEFPEGFFDQSSQDVATGLQAGSESLQQAMERLDFYINRAGKDLSGDDKARLEAVKPILRELYGRAADS